MADLKNPKLLVSVTPKDIAVKNPKLLATTTPCATTISNPILLVSGDYPLTISKDISVYAMVHQAGMFIKEIEVLVAVSSEKKREKIPFDTKRTIAFRCRKSIDTVRKIHSAVISCEKVSCDTKRIVKKRFKVSCNLVRKVFNEVKVLSDTKRKLISVIHYDIHEDYETKREISKRENISFETIRTDGTIRVNISYDTERDIVSNIGVYQCKKIDLGAEIPVDVTINIQGDGYANIRTGENFVPFKPQRLTTRYIEIQLCTTGTISKAELKIAHVEHSKTLTATIKKVGSKISYGTIFSAKPAIFLALSEYEVKIIEQTNTDVTLQLFKDGEPVEGDITFEVKGR